LPPTVDDGLLMLKRLKEKLPEQEARIRENAFDKAERLIKQAETTMESMPQRV